MTQQPRSLYVGTPSGFEPREIRKEDDDSSLSCTSHDTEPESPAGGLDDGGDAGIPG